MDRLLRSITNIVKFRGTHPRTRNYLRQVKTSVFFKVLAIGFSFLVIPMMVRYLGNEKYGIWSTLFSVLSWMVFFDFGLAKGMRNKVAEALAQDNITGARIYISTSYFAIGAISLILFGILFGISRWVSWQAVFNSTAVSAQELRKSVLIVSFFVLLNFTLAIVQQLCYAVQKSSWINLYQCVFNVFLLLLIYTLLHTQHGRILYLGGGYGITLAGTTCLLTYLFYRNYSLLRPEKKYVQIQRIRELLSLGIKFFIIQLAALIIFTTDKMIITQLFGPEFVTPYDIVYKLFSVMTIAHSLLTGPLWSTFTEAYAKGDYIWIKNTIKKINMLMIPFLIVIGLLILLAPFIIEHWIGQQMALPPLLIPLMGILSGILIWNGIYNAVLNGISKIRLGMFYTAFAAIVNIPLSIFFAQTLHYGVSGVILATICCVSFSAIVSPIQVYYFIYAVHKTKFKDTLFS